jgi:ubiquinone/menaquinone biosynthesis C-methylase UbiE
MNQFGGKNMASNPADESMPFEVLAYQSFVVGMKLHWTNTLYDKVVDEAQALGLSDPKKIEKKMQGSTTYQYYGWLEHYLQQYKFLGRWGFMSHFEPREDDLQEIVDKYAEIESDMLELNPDIKFPKYYTLGDFHQFPGGVWINNTSVHSYEQGSRTTMPTHSAHADLHTRYVRMIKKLGKVKKVLDEGCGFGKTTMSLKKEMPKADVVGVDLSEPCLKLAHRRAVEEKMPIKFVQDDIQRMKFEDDSFDIIAGSMVLHEMPPRAIRNTFKEARRVLKKGGYYTHLDFYDPPGGDVGKFIYYGHAARNREPYMITMDKMDLTQELEKAGFTDVRVEPFEEYDGALRNGENIPEEWRFPWTVIIAKAA